MKLNNRLPLSTALLLFLAAMPPAIAQIAGGSIVGNIFDPSGAPIPGATVRATNLGSNQTTEVHTNGTGYYEFPLLPAGRYQVAVEHTGFQRAENQAFDLNSGTRPRIDLTLAVGSLTENVQVVAKAPLLNTTSTELGRVIDGSKVESLPLNGRNFQQLVGLQAGVVNSPGSSAGGRGGIEFNGSPALGNNLLLDGVDMSFGEVNGTASDASGGASGGAHINTVSVEAIAEFKATGSAFSAEYGRATGGVLSVTTKSGTNQFHGTAYEYFRNDALDANNFFSNLGGLKKPPLRWNQYGGNLGGPLRKDRIFFFFNYEGAKVRQNAAIAGNVPTPALLAELPAKIADALRALPTTFTPTSNPLVGLHRRDDSRTDDENTYLSRVDGMFGLHRVAARFSYNQQDVTIPNLRPENPQIYPTRFHNAVLQDGWTIRSNMFNEVRAGLNRVDLNRTYLGLADIPAYAVISDIGINGSLLSYIHYTTTTYTLADNFSYIRGKHSFKTGFEIRNVMSSRVQGGVPTHTYATVATAIQDVPNNIQVLFGNPGRPLNDTNYGFYGQDEWRVNRQLQLNLGLRYEYYRPLHGAFNVTGSDPFGPYGSNQQAMFKADKNNFAPRLGLVYDVSGNQRTVIRAGGGITYGPPQSIFYYSSAFVDPRLPFQTTFAPSDLPANISSAFPFSQPFVLQVEANPSLLPKNFVPGRSIADYNRADEYSGQWNFTVQQALTKDLALQAAYVGSRSLKLFSTRSPNQFLPGAKTRPDPTWSDITFAENAGRSSYHALQISLNQRLRGGLTFDTYYTWAHTMSYYGADGTLTSDTSVQDELNIAGSYGPKTGEIRQLFTTIAGYMLPSPAMVKGSRLGRALLGGWNIQAILSLRTGAPLNVLSGVDLVGNQRITGQRPDYIAGADPYQQSRSSLTWLNPAAFSNTIPRAQARYGDLGYNALRAPGSISFDAALHKTFVIHEQHRITFRLEGFNAANHANLNAPVNTLSNPNFGRINGGSAGRNVQLALKYAF